MALQHVKSYIRKGRRVRKYTRQKRPKGKRIILSKQRFVARRDEYGRILGYRKARR